MLLFLLGFVRFENEWKWSQKDHFYTVLDYFETFPNLKKKAKKKEHEVTPYPTYYVDPALEIHCIFLDPSLGVLRSAVGMTHSLRSDL